MSIHVALNHKTHYRYDRLVALSPHIFRLRPAPHSRTPIEAYSLTIRPEPHFINWQQDPFGNYLARVVFPERADELYIEVDVVADMTVINPFDFFVEESAEKYPFNYSAQEAKELAPYMEIKEQGPLLTEWMSGVDRSEKPIVDFLVYLNQRLWNDLDYTVRMEPGIQTCEETLEKALGSCRDSGWLLVQALRHLGLAARFVSGYLVQLTADIEALDGPSGPKEDFTDLHAWAEVYIPGAGWLGLDPTSGLFAGEGHIPLACTPDPVSAAPVTGYTDQCEVIEFNFDNSVRRVHEDPRVTKPYTEEQWAAINALGQQIDEKLTANDVRLTMGGEPTFVSIDDMEAAEWNTAADGPHKRELAGNLIRRLQTTFGKGGIRYYGQGKWYPGEQIPRWKLACYWRTDGGPMWRYPGLLAEEETDYGFGIDHAKRFADALCRWLRIPTKYVKPGYEDIFYFLWEEGRLPANVDPLKADLKDPVERRRLAQLLERDLGQPTGYVVPLGWNYRDQAWDSSPWDFRRDQMFLIPGDSPMGLRLPLSSLPWVTEEEVEPFIERSQFDDFQPLENFHQLVQQRAESSSPEEEPPRATQIRDVVHTALSIEPRHGRLYIFMPPCSYLEHYLDLLAAIELTAEKLSMPIVLEGYEPPSDPRLQKILVTPDPGVIEVNIHPSSDWQSLVSNIEVLYEQARLSRLGTEKFMQDGRHTGTGGGNHVTMGSTSAADSPFLRRPDLLRSLVTYWQHHPGLSYLFAGMFIGPTSQAPRVDEGREEQLYELEIAFQQIPKPGEPVFPWLVDRVFRNLLVDITGNTHRAEFCIDKLYSPDSASGRLGLLEFRAFDMPPHAQMSISQMLLIRSLVAWFWEQPYEQKLVRWGTELHDRFLLPHYVEADLQEVIDDLQRAGYPFQMSWLDPFFEFRFPRYGTANIRDIELEVRMAIEPWHVLGEEVSSFGTSRYVDSSVERVQIKVSGFTGDRYLITCNGRSIPLRSTGTHGEYVAGVRYQAWQPPSSLHPTIGIHSPLVFDVIDKWHQRSVGGCRYHVAHPGGRSYDDFPVNANVAESRRVSRFWGYGHTPGDAVVRYYTPRGQWSFEPEGTPPGPAELPKVAVDPEFPHTLDLRRG
ncbi:MAG: transglutaminase family protein [Anaerolineae bacterium]|nr:transglutaminase family protein [Anaerolineae bacterium]